MTTLFKLSFRTALKTACAAFLFCAATVFVAAGQTFTSLVDFDGTNGGVPQYGSLIQGTDRNLYGVASLGGNLKLCNHYGCGTVFKMTPEGKLTTLHNFDFKDGWLAYGKLVQATDGNFYGTTSGGGFSKCGDQGCGTVFKVTP